MWLALTRPERVRALVVVDIAPVAYRRRFDTIFDALARLDLGRLEDRRQADALLADRLRDPALRGYLLQSLVRDPEGWRWRFQLPVLAASLDEILGFPDADGCRYPGASLFLYGTNSDYVSGEHLRAIRELFPLARLRAVAGPGHWVYADQPDAFVRALESFIPG